MSSVPQIFDHQSSQVRVLIIDRDPWQVAKDVCDVLEIRNSRHALSRLDDDEKQKVIIIKILSVFEPGSEEALRERSKDIAVGKIPQYTDMFKQMRDKLSEIGGVGLAMPQVGINKRAFIMMNGKKLITCVNPVITKKSHSVVMIEEGCLSVPGYGVKIPRSQSIEVRYFDENRKLHRETLAGLEAIIFQHELDHLNGVLIIDQAA